MGYLVAIGCFLLLSIISSNPGLLLILIPVVLLLVLFRSQAKKTRLKAELQREKLLEAQAAELAEQKMIETIEAQRRWKKEKAKQQQNRIQRVNRERENFRIVSEVCGVCGSKLNANGMCISGCKPLEE